MAIPLTRNAEALGFVRPVYRRLADPSHDASMVGGYELERAADLAPDGKRILFISTTAETHQICLTTVAARRHCHYLRTSGGQCALVAGLRRLA